MEEGRGGRGLEQKRGVWERRSTRPGLFPCQLCRGLTETITGAWGSSCGLRNAVAEQCSSLAETQAGSPGGTRRTDGPPAPPRRGKRPGRAKTSIFCPLTAPRKYNRILAQR
ncbi:hypothetical protein AAFF_G00228750 [Aldrovandia affinis]|uniref:Uncharacterized protein n=1 Tax=Aldrovandia affinis TaxID=143900 RepID=A0AAD7SVC0_9TELE|nr:hypothetical protein AAFF_G00228750 [Aldrovandia affinis]